jgi:hypothetical protein
MAQNKPKTTIVRAADGTLWSVTKGGQPKQLSLTETQQVTAIVTATETTLQGIVEQAMSQVAAGCTQRVHIAIPDVDI